jgi:hypothetical protein
VFPIGTKWTNITWRLMHKTMSYHLIFAFEAFATFASGAIFNGTVVWSI